MRRMALKALAARVHHDQLAAAFGELLEIGGRDGVVFGWVGPDDNGNVCVLDLVECRCHSARADIFQQRRYRRRVAEPCAVIDIVVLEGLPDQLLEQVGFLVRTFGGAEARNLSAPAFHAIGSRVQSFVPCGLAEMRGQVAGIDVQALCRRVVAADQRFGQAVFVVDIVEPKAAFHAETVLVGGAVNAIDPYNLVVLDLERQLTANTAIGADGFYLAVKVLQVALLVLIHCSGGHQRARRAGLNAFAAGDAGGRAHRVINVKHRVGIMATPGHPNHVIDLHLAAGAHTKTALNAGVQIDAHCNVGIVQ